MDNHGKYHSFVSKEHILSIGKPFWCTIQRPNEYNKTNIELSKLNNLFFYTTFHCTEAYSKNNMHTMLKLTVTNIQKIGRGIEFKSLN